MPVLSALLDLLVPPTCLVCGAPARELCGGCRRGLPWLGERTCPRCALPWPCGPLCPAADASFDAAWAPLAYEGPARDLVAAMKFRGRLAAVDVMAAQMVAGLRRHPGILVAVPAHPRRRRARGFDQASELARALGARTGRRVEEPLRRDGRATRQVGLSRERRRAPERVRFSVRGQPPQTVVLVDDVHTTGATLDACARALKEAGTRRVVALSYVRALAP
jgi:ComF family protein